MFPIQIPSYDELYVKDVECAEIYHLWFGSFSISQTIFPINYQHVQCLSCVIRFFLLFLMGKGLHIATHLLHTWIHNSPSNNADDVADVLGPCNFRGL